MTTITTVNATITNEFKISNDIITIFANWSDGNTCNCLEKRSSWAKLLSGLGGSNPPEFLRLQQNFQIYCNIAPQFNPKSKLCTLRRLQCKSKLTDTVCANVLSLYVRYTSTVCRISMCNANTDSYCRCKILYIQTLSVNQWETQEKWKIQIRKYESCIWVDVCNKTTKVSCNVAYWKYQYGVC